MKFALFRCCVTSIFLKQYETSTDAVLKALGVEAGEIREFNCCGYPLKNLSYEGYLLSSARNLSLAEKGQRDILTLCNCCYGSLRQAGRILSEDLSEKDAINTKLKEEGLQYGASARVRHFLDLLYSEIGVEGIRKRVRNSFSGVKVATHYGCHLLRPSELALFDSPVSPVKFDELVKATGAESVSWTTKTECCGAPLWGINDEVSLDMTEKKIKDAQKSGAQYLVTACPYCQLQFDRVQRILKDRRGLESVLPAVMYTQLLGLSLGIGEESLGLSRNELDGQGLKAFLTPAA
jgi:heterodisulfide reductase subunit B